MTFKGSPRRRRTVRNPRRLLLALALLLLAPAGLTPQARGEEAVTIVVDGAPRNAAELLAMADAARAASETARSVAGTDPALIDAMAVEGEALARAAALMRTIEGAPQAIEAASARLAAAQAELQQAQADAAREVVVETIDDEGIAEFENTARQRAVEANTAADTAAALAARVEAIREERDQAAQRNGQLDARAAELQAALAEVPEDDVAGRELLTRQLRSNEVRRGAADLEEAHHLTLLELATLQRDIARTEAEVAAVRQTMGDAYLAKARSLFEAGLAAEAARQAAETERKLREAELAASPAVKAIKRLEALVGRTEGDHTTERRRLSALKTTLGDASLLASISRTRLEAAQDLFPKASAMESWQRDTLAEWLRQIDRDEATYRALRSRRMPNAAAVLAQAVAQRGRLEAFQLRLETAHDRTDVLGPADRVARLEEELAYTQGEEVRLWLQARLDFIRGQNELRPAEVERLRARWQETSTQLKGVVGERVEDLRQTEGVARGLITTRDDVETSLEDRRAYLDGIAFWMRSAPVPSGPYLAALASDVRGAGAGLAALPASLAALQDEVASAPEGREHLLSLLVFGVLAVALRLWAGRRIRATGILTRPIQSLDALQRVTRAVAVVLRALLLPVLALVAAFGLRRVAPASFLLEVPIAVGLMWCGVALARGLRAAFFTPDEAGHNLAGASEHTARAAARFSTWTIVITALWQAVAHLLGAAGLTQLREALGFTWALIMVILGAWLWTRRDVLFSFIPRDAGSAFVRTTHALARIAWPIAVLLWGANILLFALGYRTASSFFAERALVFLVALLVLGMAHSMLRAWILRHAPAGDDDAADDVFDPRVARTQWIGRMLGQLLTVATLAGLVMITSAVFEIDAEDWQALGAWSLTRGEAGTGLTLARLFRALVIFAITVMIARHVRDGVRIVLRTRSSMEQGSRYVVRTLTFYLVLMIGTLAALAALGLDMTQFGWFLTAAGVGIGFGLQEIFSNLISGLILFFERPVQVGDVVTIGAVEGNVQQINIRSTVVRTRDGVSIILPNKRLITDEVVNWSHGQKRTRINSEVGVAYGSDTDLVRKVLLECADADLRVMRRPPPEVEFREFGDSQLTFILHCWLISPEISLRRRVSSDLNAAIASAFAENGITIPFPQRDVHLKSPPPPSAPSTT